jgi:hypothetical protein
MDEKAFKKHLSALVHGHHHPEEHDWGPAAPAAKKPAKTARTAKAKPAAKRSKRKA